MINDDRRSSCSPRQHVTKPTGTFSSITARRVPWKHPSDVPQFVPSNLFGVSITASRGRRSNHDPTKTKSTERVHYRIWTQSHRLIGRYSLPSWVRVGLGVRRTEIGRKVWRSRKRSANHRPGDRWLTKSVFKSASNNNFIHNYELLWLFLFILSIIYDCMEAPECHWRWVSAVWFEWWYDDNAASICIK